jgi:hypothetical protein
MYVSANQKAVSLNLHRYNEALASYVESLLHRTHSPSELQGRSRLSRFSDRLGVGRLFSCWIEFTHVYVCCAVDMTRVRVLCCGHDTCMCAVMWKLHVYVCHI